MYWSQENKTPYDLAVEQSHTKVAAMIADLRDNGPMVLAKYEKKRKRSVSQVVCLNYSRTSDINKNLQ